MDEIPTDELDFESFQDCCSMNGERERERHRANEIEMLPV